MSGRGEHHVFGELCAQGGAGDVVQRLTIVLDIVLGLLRVRTLPFADSKLVEEFQRLVLCELEAVRQQSRMHSLRMRIAHSRQLRSHSELPSSSALR